MVSTLLKHATLDGTSGSVDVSIVDGTIHEVREGLDAPDGTVGAVEIIDLEGRLLLPAAVEPHAHLDKAFLAERIENPTGDLMGAIGAMQASRHLITVEETIERAERAARMMAAHGYRAVRTHADTTVNHGLRSIEALVEVRRRLAAIIDIEIVALCGWPVVGPDTDAQRSLLVEALDAGADLVGGCPHLEAPGEARRATEFFLQTATDHAVGIDLHTDETLDPAVLGLVDLAELVLDGFEHPVTASHCVSLGMQPPHRQQEIAELVASAGIGVVALPHTNLFLQGRGHTPMPRGLTAVAALNRAGVVVAAGADNLQDPFNPVGRACPFETAGLMVLTAHLLPHEAWNAVSTAAGEVLNQPARTVTAGQPADLVAVPATTVREAIAFAPAERLVLRRGQRLELG